MSKNFNNKKNKHRSSPKKPVGKVQKWH